MSSENRLNSVFGKTAAVYEAKAAVALKRSATETPTRAFASRREANTWKAAAEMLRSLKG